MNKLRLPKSLNKSYITFFAIAVVLFWIKTYIAYQIEFKLGIDNNLQKFLLFINPLSSGLFFLGIALLFKKHFKLVLIIVNFLLSFLLYANIVYYRFFTDFITLPTIMEAKQNSGQLGTSVISLMHPTDIFYFSDLIIIIILALTVFKKVVLQNRKSYKIVLLFSITVFLFNLGLAEKDRPELLSRSFDRNYLVKYLGAYNFTIYDIIQNIQSSSERAFADSSEITDVENYRKANYAAPNPEYFGKAKGMNVIYVSLESFQNFMIDYKMPNGQEVTPFLNSLAHDGNTFYFDNFFHQTGQGKTSDAEFLMENSLYPLNQGAVFINKAQNTYQATPAILKGYGYNSAVFHGNYKTFWNRNVMYKALGYDQFFDAEYYDMSDQNKKNYGMKDKPYFKESMPMLESLKQPFYTKFITLSNHFPFEMDPQDTDFPPGDFGDTVVNDYFQSAHYMDQALEQFFNDLKADGLYDNTVIVLYGDHYGLSENHNTAMAKVLGVPEITPTINAGLQRVPLFIHVPGVKGGVQHQYGGEVDVRPTLLHLLGIDTKDYIEFGSDLLSKDNRDWALFRDGDFESPTVTQINEKCYDTKTGQALANNTACQGIDSKVKTELQMSDKVVNKDLLRFYKPAGFTPIDPNKYQYLGPKGKKGTKTP
ncbi:LTA synthase family protein [Neobacillus massiliamazoniensis]|uniref:Putative exported enzyme and anion transporter n=1 Tax=Neobacillus massiliamazoniensis TaxID=1499688 RepID=A0A0U1P0F8_9BACI|nr:LTA synthase family protein [Neobacillus massiliamazoniensis]CRK83716.1 putative exported enzyme and anion transporter [Neobacillus massiliamazoniensis]